MAVDGLRQALSERYAIERELGRGGMATVYLATDAKVGRQVAIKVLHPELTAALGGERFHREIRIATHLSHPNILPVYDSGEADGTLYYVMPFVEGESLRERLERERQLPIDEAARITCQIATALEYAHRSKVVHRDIKPENILIAAGQAVLADFGIARAVTSAADAETLTRTGMSLGTPAYMSPEQAMGERNLDGRSDQYALACVAYEMLAGQPPFTAPTMQAMIAVVIDNSIPSLVVARAKLLPNWRHEIESVLPDAKIQILKGQTPYEIESDVDFVLISYDVFCFWVDILIERHFASMIIDESQYVKNHESRPMKDKEGNVVKKGRKTLREYKTQRVRATKTVADSLMERLDDPMILLLTGTSMMNRPVELPSQLDIMGRLEPDFNGFFNFARKYCDAYEGPFGWVFTGSSNEDELRTRLRSTCMIRRTLRDVHGDLPPRRRIDLRLRRHGAHRRGNRCSHRAWQEDTAHKLEHASPSDQWCG
jgi:serine/threonine protein kinase